MLLINNLTRFIGG